MAVESQELAPAPIFDGLSRLVVASNGPEAMTQTLAPSAGGRWPGAIRLIVLVGASAAIWAAMLSMLR